MPTKTQPKPITKLSQLTPDTRNANRGTERGSQMIESSLRKYGAGRSILIDKHGQIIAGNKTAEHAASIGIDDVVVVQTDGTKVVAVQRMDLDLKKDKAAIELAIADNRAGQVSLEWDEGVLESLQSVGAVDLSQFWTKDELEHLLGGEGGRAAALVQQEAFSYKLIVDCRDEKHQAELMGKLESEGLKVHTLIS
jgi:hypothetical protein